MARLPLQIGDPAPWFAAPGVSGAKRIVFDELAGRPILLFLFASARAPDISAALSSLDSQDDLFDGTRALLVTVSGESGDITPSRPGWIHLFDERGEVAARFGLKTPVKPTAFLLSAAQQIVAIFALDAPEIFVAQATTQLRELLAAPRMDVIAPVLVAPRIFDSDLCRRLMALYDEAGGRELGLIEKGGEILEQVDKDFRMRRDHYLVDAEAMQRCREALERRLLPLVYRAFQFATTRIERYLVGCYDSGPGGYFQAHRDNTAPPVAHRRFALSIPLNDTFEGGRLRFPEFASPPFTAAPGDAIVFSCALLHEVMPVTLGRRYAFITFLYDEPAEKIREAYMKKQI